MMNIWVISRVGLSPQMFFYVLSGGLMFGILYIYIHTHTYMYTIVWNMSKSGIARSKRIYMFGFSSYCLTVF